MTRLVTIQPIQLLLGFLSTCKYSVSAFLLMAQVYCSVLGAHAVHVAMAGYTGVVVGKVDERSLPVICLTVHTENAQKKNYSLRVIPTMTFQSFVFMPWEEHVLWFSTLFAGPRVVCCDCGCVVWLYVVVVCCGCVVVVCCNCVLWFLCVMTVFVVVIVFVVMCLCLFVCNCVFVDVFVTVFCDCVFVAVCL